MLALSTAAGAAVGTPLVSTVTSNSGGSKVGAGTTLSVTFNETPALAGSYSLTLTDGSHVATLNSRTGTLSASASGARIVFTVHAPTSLSLSVLEILAATGVTDGSGNPWDLVASGQVDKAPSANTCSNVGYTRVFAGSNCSIGFRHPGPTAPDVFDVIPLPTADLPGPPDDNAPEVITQCRAGSVDTAYDVNTGVQLGTSPCGNNPPEQLIGNTNSNTLDYMATPKLASFEEVGVVETIPGSTYVSASAVPPQLNAISVSGNQATFTYYGNVVCQAGDGDSLTWSQFTYETPVTNLAVAGVLYPSAISCPPSTGGSSLTVTFPSPLPSSSAVRFKYGGYGDGHFIVGAPGTPFALEHGASESAYATVPAIPPPAPASPPTISGSPTLGQTLSESHGAWSNAPTGFTYQWQNCDIAGNNCQAIIGANGQTYAPRVADLARTLRVQETAGNASGAGPPALSSATAAVQAASAGGQKPRHAGPNTRLLTEHISSKRHSARFRFTAVGGATRFQCALLRTPTRKHAKMPSPRYSACRSPKIFSRLKVGRYVLRVRAIGAGSAEEIPAIYRFKIT